MATKYCNECLYCKYYTKNYQHELYCCECWDKIRKPTKKENYDSGICGTGNASFGLSCGNCESYPCRCERD